LRRSLPNLRVVNVLATSRLGQRVVLEKLATTPGFTYDRSIYHCAYFKDAKTYARVLIFANGEMISVGTKSLNASRFDLNYTAHCLVRLGLIPPTKVRVKLQSLVATAELGRTVDIERLAGILPNVMYEPEQFSGAIYHAEELEGASILIFANGKVVLAGLKREQMLEVGKHVLMKLVASSVTE
jgi:transcription initiation factor TFIID TATA-box-binding protein